MPLWQPLSWSRPVWCCDSLIRSLQVVGQVLREPLCKLSPQALRCQARSAENLA